MLHVVCVLSCFFHHPHPLRSPQSQRGGLSPGRPRGDGHIHSPGAWLPLLECPCGPPAGCFWSLRRDGDRPIHRQKPSGSKGQASPPSAEGPLRNTPCGKCGHAQHSHQSPQSPLHADCRTSHTRGWALCPPPSEQAWRPLPHKCFSSDTGAESGQAASWCSRLQARPVGVAVAEDQSGPRG